jgi:O-antigen/teichoic acid export membrane protein
MALGVVSTVAFVGIFALSSQISLVGRAIHRSIVASALPLMAELYDRDDRAHLADFYRITSKWTFALNLPFFLVMVLLGDSLLAIFGKDFAAGAQALSILACASLVETGTGLCGAMLDMTGHSGAKLVNSVAAVTLTIGLNVLLIPPLGLLGAALASLAASVLINALRIAQVLHLVGMFPYSVGFLKPVAAAAGTAIFIHLIDQQRIFEWLPADFVTKSLLLAGVYAATLLLLGLEAEDRRLLAQLFRRPIRMPGSPHE